MRWFHDPATILKTVAAPLIGGVFGALNKPKATKAQDPAEIEAKEKLAARNAAKQERSARAGVFGRDAAIGAMASLGSPQGARRTVLGVN